jgi:hypothetical protein
VSAVGEVEDLLVVLVVEAVEAAVSAGRMI